VSTLIYTKLRDILEHEIRITSNDRVHIAAFCPYLLKYGTPPGTFTFSVLQDEVTFFSKTFISSDISSVGYAHSYFPIVIGDESALQLTAGLYTLRISSAGYTFVGSSHIGWIQQYQNKQNEAEYNPASDYQNPLTVRIKTYNQGIL
jgi:hypothetical protein